MIAPIATAFPSERLTGALGLSPKYSRLRENILRLVRELEPDSVVPPERVLCEQYGVSRTTVQRAIQELVREGVLYRQQGRGTFVAQPKLVQTIQLQGHTVEMEAEGLRPGSRLIAASDVPSSEEAAAFFELEPGMPIHRVVRLRLVDGRPMAIQTVHLDSSRFRDIGAALAASVSLYDVLRERYQVRLDRAEETIESSLADDAEAELLETEVGLPLLVLSRRSWEAGGRPLELAESRYRGDRYRVLVRLDAPVKVEP